MFGSKITHVIAGSFFSVGVALLASSEATPLPLDCSLCDDRVSHTTTRHRCSRCGGSCLS